MVRCQITRLIAWRGETTTLAKTAADQHQNSASCGGVTGDYFTEPYGPLRLRVPTGTGCMAQLLLVDDNAPLLDLTRRVLERDGHQCTVALDATSALECWADGEFELVVCDLLMPDATGLTFLSRIADRAPHTASIVMTAINEPDVADQALDLGVYGYVVKPIDPPGLIIAVRSALKRREAELQSARLNLEMTNLVHRRTETLMGTIQSLQADSRTLALQHEESIHALSTAAEFRGLRRSAHTYRVGRFAALLAKAAGLPRQEIQQIRLAAALHDIGNVVIPKEILTKPGPLEPGEMKIVRNHVRLGFRILNGYESELMETAAKIALTHHERWDGSGYPDRLAGESIPIEGRIVAIVDVFDALASERSHRDSLEVGDAFAFIEHGSGSLFDPELVSAFLTQRSEVERLLHKYPDHTRMRRRSQAEITGDL